MLKTYLLLSIFVFTNLSFAKTLFISDIDDTIKISHVLDKDQSLRNAFLPGNIFLGINELYASVKNEHPDFEFFYLSNAPEFLMNELHQYFVEKNQFPQGQVLLRGSIFEENFKVKKIRELIEEKKPTDLILIGDNGEKDILVYQEILQRYPDLKISTFIHTVYDSEYQDDEYRGLPLLDAQVPFVTSLDLAKEFNKLGFVSNQALSRFVSKNLLKILEQDPSEGTGALAFPNWLNCKDYLRIKPLSNIPAVKYQRTASDKKLITSKTPTITDFYSHLKFRCSMDGYFQD